MKTGKIIFTTRVDYFGEGPCDITIVKDKLEAHVYLFADAAMWRNFGRELIDFPRHADERVTLDASRYDPFRDSLFLEAYCYDPQGHTALRVVVGNNQDAPYGYKLDFSIPAEAASLNQLGQLFLRYIPETVVDSASWTDVIWEARSG